MLNRKVMGMSTKLEGSWVPPPEVLRLADGEVHLWRIDLGIKLPEWLDSVVSPDELDRAERFRFEEDRQRYLLSSYAVREVLSRYLSVAPGDVRMAITAKGKPYLKGEGLNFSLSHAKRVAAVAVARARVGVDVEDMVIDYPHMEVAERFFVKGEVEALKAEGDPLKRVALFFSYWTRKEALLKASGEGLYEDLKDTDFSKPGSTAGFRIDHGGSRWTVAELEPAQGVFCSVALEGDLRSIERYAWEPVKSV
jgi:4'-phosphopantetheinyl transferase